MVSLMYHDVVPAGDPAASGFPSGDAARYKLAVPSFRNHLNALAASPAGTLICVLPQAAASSVLLTFDDGGISFHDPIAGLLEERGWRGHFFITTGFLDSPGFLSPAHVRDLHARGHIIGSHSCSHPLRMATLGRQELRREWSESVQKLSAILGTAVDVASVPGGMYSRAVAETAAESGITTLFTSEPTIAESVVDGCRVLGRFAMIDSTPASVAVALAEGHRVPRFRQALSWNTRKILKKTFGAAYLSLRAAILNRGSSAVET